MDERPDWTTEATCEEMLLFLDKLRESGETNMFGAAPYLQGHSGISQQEAEEMLKYWMLTFETRHPN